MIADAPEGKIDLVDLKPADKVERPQKEKFVADYYKSEEINKLLEVSKGTHLDFSSKLLSADAMLSGLGIEKTESSAC